MKTCRDCEQAKPLTEFYYYANGTPLHICKACHCLRMKVRRLTDPYDSSTTASVPRSLSGSCARKRPAENGTRIILMLPARALPSEGLSGAAG
jgi:hypothetical protein